MNNHTILSKYPYAGSSQSLMEYFYIIGYSKDKISNLTSKNNLQSLQPEILSIINNSNKVNVVDSEIILHQVFPSIPAIIDLNEQKSRPKKSTVIFMINPDDYHKPIKNPSCCSGLIFHESNKSNPKLLIPKAFCIISQYPFFSFFNDLNKRIFDLFKKNLEIPIEIIIYNMLNFIPAPINFDLELNIFPLSEPNSNLIKSPSINNPNNGIASEARAFSTVSVNSNSSVGSNNSNNITYKLRQLSGYPQIDMDIIKLFNFLPIENIIEIFLMLLLEIDVIFFSKNLEILNPLMYILSKLTFPCDDSIYQWNIVSVSKLEFSNENIFSGRTGTLIIGVNCSYDSSIETYKVRGNNFVVDLDNKKLEYITTCQEEFDTMNNFRKFIKASIFPSISYSYIFSNPNSGNTNFFYWNFLNKFYNDILYLVNKYRTSLPAPYNNQIFINSSTAANERQTIANNHNSSNFNNINEAYGLLFDFFDYSDIDRIYKTNKEVQEVFYSFMIQLLSVFYSFFKLKSISEKNIDISEENNNFFIKCIDENIDKEFFDPKYKTFNENEKFFYNNFISTKRYDKFFSGYIVKNDANNMHKMPFLITEEFIYVFKSQSIDLTNVIYKDENVLKPLSLIDQFYSHYNQISTIIQKSEVYKDFKIYNEECSYYNQIKHLLKFSFYVSDAGKTLSDINKFSLCINFEDFYKIYFDSLAKDIFKFDNINLSQSVINVTYCKNKKLINHDYCEFENNFLFNYFYYLHNYCETKPIDEIFPYNKISKINTIPIIKSTDFADAIENEYLKFSNLNIDNVLIYSLINLFMIMLGENFSSEFYSSLKELLNIIKNKNIYVRKYLELILNTFVHPRFIDDNCDDYNNNYNNPKDSLPNDKFQAEVQGNETKLIESRKSFYGKRTSSYYVLVNFIREQDILPTENFLKILNLIINGQNKGNSSTTMVFSDQEETETNYEFDISFQYNRCKCGFKNREQLIQETLGIREDENVYLNCKVCNKVDKKTIFIIKIVGSELKVCYNSEIFSIRKLFKTSKDLLKDYLKSFEINKLDIDLMKNLILNLMFYCHKDFFNILKTFLFKCYNLIILKMP